MAASARDARRKSLAPGSSIGGEETPGLDEGEGDKEVVVMKGKRRAIMRKKPLFTRYLLSFSFPLVKASADR